MKSQVAELVECLEICLKNIEQDTLPMPAQVKRIRQAIADGKASLLPSEPRINPAALVNKLEQVNVPAITLPLAHAPRPKISKLQVTPVEYTPLPPYREPRPKIGKPLR